MDATAVGVHLLSVARVAASGDEPVASANDDLVRDAEICTRRSPSHDHAQPGYGARLLQLDLSFAGIRLRHCRGYSDRSDGVGRRRRDRRHAAASGLEVRLGVAHPRRSHVSDRHGCVAAGRQLPQACGRDDCAKAGERSAGPRMGDGRRDLPAQSEGGGPIRGDHSQFVPAGVSPLAMGAILAAVHCGIGMVWFTDMILCGGALRGSGAAVPTTESDARGDSDVS